MRTIFILIQYTLVESETPYYDTTIMDVFDDKKRAELVFHALKAYTSQREGYELKEMEVH